MIYYPYPANNGKNKYYIITREGNKVFFGAYGMNDYTIYYRKYGKEYADERRQLYIRRHEGEDWSNPNKSAYWSRWLLWEKPTIKEAYAKIKNDL
jgi:hypothetical protein